MANTREELVNRFIAFSGIGKKQAATGTGMANDDIDTRLKCTITREEVITRRDIRDCRNEDLTDSQVITRLGRYTLAIAEVTPQIESLFSAYFFGQASVTPASPPQNEIQQLAKSGTAPGDTFKINLTLEGRSVKTAPIGVGATVTDIINALTASRMLFIHPGDVSGQGGIKQVETLLIVGTCTGDGSLPVTVKAGATGPLSGAGKTINVPILNTDTASVVAGKVRVALAADVDVAAFFTISGSGANVIATAKIPAANDVTMELSNTAVFGMTAATSSNTTPGVSSDMWDTAGVQLTFQNRLGKADIPLMTISDVTGGGTVTITGVQNGANNHHTFTRSTDRNKVRFTFCLGYEDNTATLEKYIDYAVESINPQASLGTDPSLQVVMVGPWEYDSLEPSYTVPDCVNPTPLRTEECRVKIDGNFESADVNSVNSTLNDNVPIDRLSAFPYDGSDVQNLIRGKQPAYQTQASIFGIRTDHVYALAQNERGQDPVEVITHYGMPGNRFTLLQPTSKIRFQNSRETFVGTAEFSAVNIEALPLKETTSPPLSAEAYLDQTTAFLTT